MIEHELYQQKAQAHLDERKAEIAVLKAKVSGLKAEAQIAMNAEIAALECRLKEAEAMLAELVAAGDEAAETLKRGADSAWESLQSAVHDAAAKFKN
jgi:hypothetical protein